MLVPVPWCALLCPFISSSHLTLCPGRLINMDHSSTFTVRRFCCLTVLYTEPLSLAPDLDDFFLFIPLQVMVMVPHCFTLVILNFSRGIIGRVLLLISPYIIPIQIFHLLCTLASSLVLASFTTALTHIILDNLLLCHCINFPSFYSFQKELSYAFYTSCRN